MISGDSDHCRDRTGDRETHRRTHGPNKWRDGLAARPGNPGRPLCAGRLRAIRLRRVFCVAVRRQSVSRAERRHYEPLQTLTPLRAPPCFSQNPDSHPDSSLNSGPDFGPDSGAPGPLPPRTPQSCFSGRAEPTHQCRLPMPFYTAINICNISINSVAFFTFDYYFFIAWQNKRSAGSGATVKPCGARPPLATPAAKTDSSSSSRIKRYYSIIYIQLIDLPIQFGIGTGCEERGRARGCVCVCLSACVCCCVGEWCGSRPRLREGVRSHNRLPAAAARN